MREDRRDRQADIHVAEYNALTNRITCYVTLQYGVLAIAAGLFGYLVPLWWEVRSHQDIEWLGLLSVLAVSWAALHINHELLLTVLYLFQKLLPRMGTDSALELDEVLGFEGWLSKLGRVENFNRNQAPLFAFFIGAVALLVLLGKDLFYTHWSYSDTGWVLVAGPVFLFLCMQTWRLSVLRSRIGALVDR